MDAFLRCVARVYAINESNSLYDCCFVFPNKRSGAFFRQYLSEELSGEYIEPEITTISDFISGFSDKTEASRFEQLFILYTEYKKLTSDIVDFDQFQFWGDMILNDFNDVDKYLVDAKQLFVNVQRYKEINANYLTEEQRKVIEQYWGEVKSFAPIDQFWTHINSQEFGENQPTGKFVKLWEVLYDLYEAFRKTLVNKGLCNSGMQYRNAVDVISKMSPDELPYRRIVFVGFNVLSTSEVKVFDLLKNAGVADFYWDYNSPMFADESNRAIRFIGEYIKKFKAKYDLCEPQITELPRIVIKGVPSVIGQTKEAAQIISDLVKNGDIPTPKNAINTAIVLPDENLFIPLMHSIPAEFETINVTMGYPLRYASISGLVSNIVSMQLNARRVKGEYVYYYEDVQNVLAHPFVYAVAGEDCQVLKDHITEKRIFSISAQELCHDYKQLAPLFKEVPDTKNSVDVFEYMESLLRYLYTRVSAQESGYGSSVDIGFLARYIQALHLLKKNVTEYHIDMQERTFFHLLERAISSESVNFVGEPLSGLQIMGVLETRAIDFENLILLSMNERVFPRKHYSKSFIPNVLRRGYGMATIEFQECIYAYYFYRMIARAKNVFLLYDSRQTGGKNGEMSRYLQQLLYLHPQDNIQRFTVDYNVIPSSEQPIEIAKTPEIMARLDRFRDEHSGKNLSASTINKYINCSLQFYFENVMDLHIKDEVTDYMDSSTYGTIVHEVAQRIYDELLDGHDEVVITKEVLEEKQHSDIEIEKKITKSVNIHFNKIEDEAIAEQTPLIGEAKLLGNVMKLFLKKMFEAEKNFAPFSYIKSEMEIMHRWKITDDITINIRQLIDRVDRKDGSLRIVDYKTGSDKNNPKNIAALFDGSDKNRCKAILQLFIYCNVYAESQKYEEPIQPILYLLKGVAANGLNPVTIGGEELVNYQDYNEEFMDNMRGVITEMYNPEIPFRQAEHDHSCKFCKFKSICGKS